KWGATSKMPLAEQARAVAALVLQLLHERSELRRQRIGVVDDIRLGSRQTRKDGSPCRRAEWLRPHIREGNALLCQLRQVGHGSRVSLDTGGVRMLQA